jgi:putative oxidoreductase
MTRAFLIGRVVSGCFYLMSAWNHFSHVGTLAKYVGAHGVPLPTVAVLAAGVLLLIGGLSLLLGVFPRLGVAALIVFFVPVTLVMHAFWNDQDPVQRMNDFVNFTKNIALVGSTLMFLAVPQPWPYSIERRWRLPVRAQV